MDVFSAVTLAQFNVYNPRFSFPRSFIKTGLFVGFIGPRRGRFFDWTKEQ